jgi:hypothetical protein
MEAFLFLHTLVKRRLHSHRSNEVSRGTPVLGGAVPKWRIMKSVMCSLIIVVSLCAFAQVLPVPDVSGLVSDRKVPAFPVTVVQPAPFEFRGIRIGDGMKEAERKFLALKVPSLSSKPGLCGSDGMPRIETCTDILDTGEYVNMTMLDRRVAQIYVSTDQRTLGNSYNSYVAALGTTYGTPNRLETKYYRNGVETGSSGEHLRWSNGDQYMEGSEAERAITIGSTTLDVEIAKQEASL